MNGESSSTITAADVTTSGANAEAETKARPNPADTVAKRKPSKTRSAPAITSAAEWFQILQSHLETGKRLGVSMAVYSVPVSAVALVFQNCDIVRGENGRLRFEPVSAGVSAASEIVSAGGDA